MSGTMSEDSGDDSAVMVEHNEAEEPCALQIVSIGTEEDSYAFAFIKENLDLIMKGIPADTKVSVVSVVGAFRTGKSFLLSFFLRYLSHLQDIETKKEKSSSKWYDDQSSLGNDGFDWRGGSERNTTGIWMWSHPFFVQNLAVLLVDTQGMFDNETTMSLTASIFGLSTLLSSYEIYNVDKKIGEDALQQLSLFSEYARKAMATNKEKEGQKPFQQIEFLVRDWQHFEDEENHERMVEEMDVLLKKVMASREASDLQETRDQITMCFERITCYGLTHPGMAVTRKNYAGEIDKIDKVFLGLLDRYCPRVFDNLQPKKIHGRELTGGELASYIEEYAKLFASGASFPEAKTMLEATAAANNTNALNLALKSYKETMDRVAGPQCSNYITKEELLLAHKENLTQCLDVFKSIANFGSRSSIQKSERNLMEKIESDYVVYEKLNDSRNPLLGLEIYAVPLTVGVVAYILRVGFDWTCSPYSQICRSSSELLSHTLAVILFFIIIVASTKAKQIGDFLKRLQVMFETMNGSPSGPRGPKAKKD